MAAGRPAIVQVWGLLKQLGLRVWQGVLSLFQAGQGRLHWLAAVGLALLAGLIVLFLVYRLWRFSAYVLSLLGMFTTMLLIPAFLSGIIYGRDDDRAFAVGGLTATLTFLFYSHLSTSAPQIPLWLWPAIWLWILLAGWVSSQVRAALLARYGKRDNA